MREGRQPTGRRRAWSIAIRCAAVPLVLLAAVTAPGDPTDAGLPDILLITVDTLRADHVSAYGYSRSTTPHLDELIAAGLRFDLARTVEPLTTPALTSMLTSRDPHLHGANRNGLLMRTGLPSLPKSLQAQGYRTVACIGNWTLRDKLSGMAEHFEEYNEILTRKRYFGLVLREATAKDLTAAATDWIAAHERTEPNRPFFVWVHYVEPHAPYRVHREHLDQLGLKRGTSLPDVDRYDTEIAFTDASIGGLLRSLDHTERSSEPLIVFAADHGESLGEHRYWGHGRHLYEPTLRIPMSITWPGRIEPQTVEAPALITDLAPTVLGLLDLPAPAGFSGFDWTGVLRGDDPPADRVTRYQAHKGAVMSRHDSELARRTGLLAVGQIRDNRKEIFRIEKNRTWLFDLSSDPAELASLIPPKQDPTEELLDWMRVVYRGLNSLEHTPPQPLDEESVEKLRSLGYID
jgi:arylsulfatase A-like enzyme